MLAAFTHVKNAEKVKKFLVKNQALHYDYLPQKELDHIYFPIIKKITVPDAQVVDTKFTFPQKPTTVSVNDLLKGKLTKRELAILPQSQEIVGDIMILEIPEELHPKEKIIAEAFLQYNKNITTVVRKSNIHSGVYRTRKVKILAGKKTKETIHHENGVKIKLHLEKTYFSARSGNERLRLAKLIKKGEEVLVMFSGAAPYPLVIAKNSAASKIYGIELNPLAHQYALENVVLNKLQDKIVIYEGNVLDIVPKLRKKFHRIIMPLPKTGEEFLPLALPKVKEKGFIHLYAFLNETEIDSEAKRLTLLCKSLKHSVRIIGKIKCGQFSPGTFRVCFDIQVL